MKDFSFYYGSPRGRLKEMNVASLQHTGNLQVGRHASSVVHTELLTQGNPPNLPM